MTQDIIEMARQAGANVHFSKHHIAFIETFAKLVEAKASAKEREACAKVCIDIAHKWTCMGAWGQNNEYHECAEAIRARGEQQ